MQPVEKLWRPLGVPSASKKSCAKQRKHLLGTQVIPQVWTAAFAAFCAFIVSCQTNQVSMSVVEGQKT